MFNKLAHESLLVIAVLSERLQGKSAGAQHV